MSGLERAQQAILDAIVDAQAWDPALKLMAEACGGRTGQLIAQKPDGQILTHHLNDFPVTMVDRIVACGLNNESSNPRFQMGHKARPMTLYADQDYVTEDQRRRLLIYTECFESFDLVHNCQVVLLRSPHLVVRASVTRTRAQNIFDRDDFQKFSELTPYLQLAARHYALMGNEMAQVAVSALDAGQVTAFVLNENGRVIDATQQAQRGAETGEGLRISNGSLYLRDTAMQEALMHAVRRVAHMKVPSASLMLTQGVLEILPCPYTAGGWAGLMVLAVLREPRNTAEFQLLLRKRYALTQAEAEIASDLSHGVSATEIARKKQVSIATVRSQVQSVYSKVGIRRQMELISLLRPPYVN